MALGIALFASVVLVLAVYHKEFRRVFFWVAGISAIGAGMFFLSRHLYRGHVAKQQAETERRFKACVARFPIPYILDGQRMSAFGITAACTQNPDFTPVLNPSYVASIVDVRGGGTLHISPPQQFSSDGDPDFIPVIYLGHGQTFVLVCGNYGEQGTSISINQGLVSCPASNAEHECTPSDEKPAKWGKFIELSLRDCTKNGCVVYNGKRIVGGITRNEITSAQWDTCDASIGQPDRSRGR